MTEEIYWGNALVLTGGRFRTPNGKTAHGLVRETRRFSIKGLVDPAEPEGVDAGEILDGRKRGILFYPSFESAFARLGEKPPFCIIGMAIHGGRLTPELRRMVLQGVDHGLHMVNGLHDFLSEDAEIRALAEKRGVKLTDIRKSKPRKDLHFWTGAIMDVRAPRLAILGTDCNIGKRTTSRLLLNACLKGNIKAELVYTGQTGWMQGGKYGFILDSVVNDFVSGELENSIVRCDQEENPHIILLEGQSSLHNPSGPCGLEYLLSAQAKGVILQHAPGRVYFEGFEEQLFPIPPLPEIIRAIQGFGSRVLAVTLNQQNLSDTELAAFQSALRKELSVPVVCPLKGEMDVLLPLIKEYIHENKKD